MRAAAFIAILWETFSLRPRCIFFRVFDTHVNHSTRMLTICLYFTTSAVSFNWTLPLHGDFRGQEARRVPLFHVEQFFENVEVVPKGLAEVRANQGQEGPGHYFRASRH